MRKIKFKNPLISVLLPIGKDRRFLDEAIEGINNQSYKPTELLIGEDKKSEGITRTLIKLVKRARGEFLARMDADDISGPERIEKQVGFLTTHPDVMLVGTWATLIDERGEKIGLQKMPVSWEEIKKQAFFRNPLIHSSWMMRRKWFEKIGGYNPRYKYSQDWELLLRTVWKYQIENIPEPLIKLRIHERSVSFANNKQQLWYGIKARGEAIERRDAPFWKVIYLLPRIISFTIPAKLKYLFRFRLNRFRVRPGMTTRQTLGIVLPMGQNKKRLEEDGQWSLWQQELKFYRQEFDGIEFFEYRFQDWRRYIEALLVPFIRVKRFKRCRVLKAVHLTGAIPCLMAKQVYKIPFVLSYGYRYDEFAALERRWPVWLMSKLLTPPAVKFSDAVMVPTKELGNYVSRFEAKKIAMIPNGVDTRVFKSLILPRQNQALSENQQVSVLFVGRLEKQKNLEILIRAVYKLLKGPTSQGPTLEGRTLINKLVFIGTGSLRCELTELANTLGINLEIIRPISNEELPEIYQQADIFVLPSLMEGHPKVLLEAMACGLPCLASNIPGVNEIIIDGKNGLLVEPTIEGIAGGLRKLIANPQLWKNLGQAARKTVLEKFDKRKLMEKECSLLRDFITK